MADVTNIIKDLPGGWYQHAGRNHCSFRLDFSKNGIGEVGTHQVFTIPQGSAFLGGWFIVEEDFIGGTSVRFRDEAAGVLTGAINTAMLVEGAVRAIGIPPLGGVGSAATKKTYAKDSDLTIDVESIGTYTSGIMFVLLDFISVDSFLEQEV